MPYQHKLALFIPLALHHGAHQGRRWQRGKGMSEQPCLISRHSSNGYIDAIRQLYPSLTRRLPATAVIKAALLYRQRVALNRQDRRLGGKTISIGPIELYCSLFYSFIVLYPPLLRQLGCATAAIRCLPAKCRPHRADRTIQQLGRQREADGEKEHTEGERYTDQAFTQEETILQRAKEDAC